MFAVYTVYIYTTDTTYQLEVLRMGRREPQKDTTTEEKKNNYATKVCSFVQFTYNDSHCSTVKTGCVCLKTMM